MTCSIGKLQLWAQQIAHLLEACFLCKFTSLPIILSNHPRFHSAQRFSTLISTVMVAFASTSSKSSGAPPSQYPRCYCPFALC